MNISVNYDNLNKHILFLFLVSCAIAFTLLLQGIVISDKVYYDHFSETLPLDKITELLQFQEKWWWVNYVMIPIIYTLKFSFLSLWLLTAAVFMGYKTSYKKLFHAAILAEFVVLIPIISKVIWFSFFQRDFTFLEIQLFNPFSLISFFDIESLEPWLVYPIQSINILEIVYIIVLAFGVKSAIRQDYNTALKFTLPAYLLGLVIWIIFITFLTINLSS